MYRQSEFDMKTLNYRNYTIVLDQDEYCESPNEWEDNELFLLAKHREFDVSRKEFDIDEIFDNIEETNIWEWGEYKLFPLFAYIHSGISLSTSRVCQWDSSLVGLIFVSKEFETNEQDRLVNSLLSNWNTYLMGDVWRYEILSKNGEQIDALSGIYGYEYTLEEAKDRVDWEVKKDIRKFFTRKKIEIKNRIPLNKRLIYNI